MSFRPEFLNRIDEIVVFHQLTQEQIVQMVELLIGRVRKQLSERDMDIELTQKAKDLLAQRGFDPVLGARPLRRTIQREIEDQLSEKILFGEIGAGDLIKVDVEGWDGESKDNTGASFVFTPTPKPLPEGTFADDAADVEVRETDEPQLGDAEAPQVIDPAESAGDDDGHNPPPAGAGQPL